MCFLISANAADVASSGLVLTNTDGTNTSSAMVRTNASPVQLAKTNLPPIVAEIVRLKEAEIADEVIVAFIQKSPPVQPLPADRILYLKDLGLSPRVLTALLEHQQAGQPSASLSSTNTPMPPWGPGSTLPQYLPGGGNVTEDMMGAVPEGAVNDSELPGPAYVNPADYGIFYSTLAPYGKWLVLDGGWVWQPTAAAMNPSWRPYCNNGHWRWSDCGWYWQSDYSWGWAPFHYGRWSRHSEHGWVWQPDRTWGPAWVNWRQSANYSGWAPLPPDVGFSMNTGWTFRGQPVRGPQDFGLPASSFTFVPSSMFLDTHLFYRSVHGDAVKAVFHQTRPIDGNGFMLTANRRVLNVGVNPQRIAALTQRPLQPTRVSVGSADMSGQVNGLPDGQLPFAGIATRTAWRPVRPFVTPTPSGGTLAGGRWVVNPRTGYLVQLPADGPPPGSSFAFVSRAFRQQMNTAQPLAGLGQQMGDLGQPIGIGDLGQSTGGIGDIGQSRGALGQRPNGLANPPNAPFGFSPMVPSSGGTVRSSGIMSGGGQSPGIIIYGGGGGGFGGRGGGRGSGGGGGGHSGGGGGHSGGGGGHGGGGGGHGGGGGGR